MIEVTAKIFTQSLRQEHTHKFREQTDAYYFGKFQTIALSAVTYVHVRLRLHQIINLTS